MANTIRGKVVYLTPSTIGVKFGTNPAVRLPRVRGPIGAPILEPKKLKLECLTEED